MSTPTISARMHRNGTIVRIKPDGTQEPLLAEPPRPMSAEEIERRAAADAENPPLTLRRRARLRPVPRVRTLRRALGLTQQEFAGRYHIPLGTLRDWEQGRTEPDQPARAYLMVIARAPETIVQVLGSASK